MLLFCSSMEFNVDIKNRSCVIEQKELKSEDSSSATNNQGTSERLFLHLAVFCLAVLVLWVMLTEQMSEGILITKTT